MRRLRVGWVIALGNQDVTTDDMEIVSALKLALVSEEDFDRVVDPAKMVHPYVAQAQ